MTQNADGLSRKLRKQLATFKGELCRSGVMNEQQLKDHIAQMPRDRFERIAGLVPYVFSKPTARPS
ncbi:MAG: hypothetical protein A2660_03050 [Candidatus Doudnabacteria bacterium RIFCSPHIGHO2_01_FULL_45_18]|uniref:Uncharacterized protein n=1 Tax=Candidatus Doudnabacteria bacterium RIFCSPHIGHO2_01_FULL_45_18 TaxID=1817823 RepID=A0A1F5NPV6_9BACT|nr:MAG: hypothetical protein A2660_03050 [Candidatus Doudnabacteria bacterium RIFCSPHIGHO2_01_FULL_45_18]